MTNCPTCGQPILPSMGDKVARKVDQAQARTHDIRTQQEGRVPLTLRIGEASTVLDTESTPRGYKTQHLHRKDGKRYRIRVQLTRFPKKGTIGGKVSVIELEQEKKVTVYQLPEKPLPWFSYSWTVLDTLLGTVVVTV